MKFSIITPTLQRDSLLRCCQSLDEQSFQGWEHIVVADVSQDDYTLFDMHSIRDQKRLTMRSPRVTHQWGNYQRHLAWEWAAGDYILHVDDDNAMYRPDALADIAAALESDNYPDFAIFPIHRHGSIFLMLPPGLCRTDTANVVVKREIGRWPDIEAREADGHWVEALKAKYAFTAFPDMPPIILMEKSSNGV